MRCPTLAALLCLLLIAGLVEAKPLVRSERGPDSGYRPGIHVEGGALRSSAGQDTTYFGGTVWDPVDGRWEGYPGGIWTFDTGVGSDFDHSAPDVDLFKDTSLHARMEGWVGIDFTYAPPSPFFRRLEASDPRWGAVVCVGAPAGLGGNASLWAGYLPDEADSACFASGQGYPNNWMTGVRRSFVYPGTGTVTLEFDYRVDMEAGFDYTRVLVDTAGAEPVEVTAYTGTGSGSASLELAPGVELPTGGGSFSIVFLVDSDGAYSDEDGLSASACGAFALDDVALIGAVSYGPEDFESDDGGWILVDTFPGVGDLTDLVLMDDIPPSTFVCGNASCGLVDSVLVVGDLGNPPMAQPLGLDNIAASPWIELGASAAAPIRFVEFSLLTDNSLLNYVFHQVLVQYYPDTCPVTGEDRISSWTANGFVIFGNSRFCSRKGQVDFSDVLPPGVERVRIGLGVFTSCRFFANCTGLSNPVAFDNARFGVAGAPGAPFINASSIDLPQDAFPEAGDLGISSSGRLDCNNVKGDTQPESFTALGDTLIVAGAKAAGSGFPGAEVRVQFAIDPGPGIDLLQLGIWLALHPSEGSWLTDRRGSPLQWFSARMDTALIGNVTVANTWATLYHEEDPNFSGDQFATDPDDLDPRGQQTRKLNDIFPDDLFTPGTRIHVFYKARYLDGGGIPVNALWCVFPDTSDGTYLEAEILPSSMDADGEFNCVLFVNHFDGRPGEARFEEALAATLPGSGSNAEGTVYDRYDVRSPWTQQASLGRPFGTEYGAAGAQLLGYRSIVWHTGNLSAFGLTNEDAQALNVWYAYADEPRNLYLSGDGLITGLYRFSDDELQARDLVETDLGVAYVCNSVRNDGCPSGSVVDTMDCIPVDGIGGSHFLAAAASIPGNGCPTFRALDVLGVSSSATGDARGNLTYEAPVKGSVSYASVSHVQPAGHRSVVDGFSTAYLLAGACSPTSTAADRLTEVFAWFGETGADGCYDTGATLGVDEDPAPGPSGPVFGLRLVDGAFLRGPARFHLTAPTGGEVRLEIYDVAGRRVAEVYRGRVPEGGVDAVWNTEGIAASGVYFARLAGAETITRRFVVLR